MRVYLVLCVLALGLVAAQETEGRDAATVMVPDPTDPGNKVTTADGTAANAEAGDGASMLEANNIGSDFVAAFLASISMIIVSELGDKTFFIAAIMAMKHSRTVVFGAAIAALALMTVLSAAMGNLLPNLLPHTYTHYAAALLFVFFGFKLVYEAYGMDPNEANEELEEVEHELEEAEEREHEVEMAELEAGEKEHPKLSYHQILAKFFSPIFLQAFSMTFLAEWGDRSQIATIALAAAKDPFGVTLGGIIGHALCTALAVLGGKILATSISERMVCFTGGILFLIFAGHSFYYGPEEV